MKSIVFTGGGTAGHIMPNLAIINDLNNYKIYYLGSNGMEKDIISKQKNIEFIEIPCVKFKRSLSIENFKIPFKLISAIKTIKNILQRIKPSLIFSKGGYVSLPVCLAGHKLHIPVITHESDLSMGLANKIISKKANYTCCSFKTTADKLKNNGIFTGSPIRRKILNGNKSIITQQHKITNNLPNVLIVGGSQGAQTINNTIWNNITNLTDRYNVFHIVGKNKLNKEINVKNYYQIEFADDIENYFSAADLVVSRSGSNTIFELLSLAKPMILIPLPKTKHSRGDQVDNAKYFKENKFAFVLEQKDLTPETLEKAISYTLKNKLRYTQNMKNANNTIGNPKIIQIIEETIK